MAFATRADLLARSNARRLAQLAVPADLDMVPDDALRAAIAGDDLAGYSDTDQAALTLALDAIDKSLGDADALLQSYGIPANVQSTLLARLASTVALYYLQGAERMTEDMQKAYDAVLKTLGDHSKGTLNLLPADGAEPPAPQVDAAIIISGHSRYGRRSSDMDSDLRDCEVGL